MDADLSEIRDSNAHIAASIAARSTPQGSDTPDIDKHVRFNDAFQSFDVPLAIAHALAARVKELTSERNEWECSAKLYHSELRDLAEGKKVETQLGFPVEKKIRDLQARVSSEWAVAIERDAALATVEQLRKDKKTLTVVLKAISESYWTDGESERVRIDDLQDMARAAIATERVKGDEPPTCRQCGANMQQGQAIPPAMTDHGEGAYVGYVPLNRVWKCPKCGHSFEQRPNVV